MFHALCSLPLLRENSFGENHCWKVFCFVFLFDFHPKAPSSPMWDSERLSQGHWSEYRLRAAFVKVIRLSVELDCAASPNSFSIFSLKFYVVNSADSGETLSRRDARNTEMELPRNEKMKNWERKACQPFSCQLKLNGFNYLNPQVDVCGVYARCCMINANYAREVHSKGSLAKRMGGDFTRRLCCNQLQAIRFYDKNKSPSSCTIN